MDLLCRSWRQETKHLPGFRLPLDFIEMFGRLIHAEVVAKRNCRSRESEAMSVRRRSDSTEEIVAARGD